MLFRNFPQKRQKFFCRSFPLPADIHTRRLFFVVAEHTVQKLPAVTPVKSGMVGKQIYRGYPFCFQIADRHIEQLPGYTPAAVLRIGIHRTDIWRRILSAMEVVFDNAQTAGDPSAAQAEIPAVFGITVQI